MPICPLRFRLNLYLQRGEGAHQSLGEGYRRGLALTSDILLSHYGLGAARGLGERATGACDQELLSSRARIPSERSALVGLAAMIQLALQRHGLRYHSPNGPIVRKRYEVPRRA
jgi:hypothetical protein